MVWIRRQPELKLRKAIENLTQLANKAFVGADVKRYMADIVVFLRMHRAVAGGISAGASRYFEWLVK